MWSMLNQTLLEVYLENVRSSAFGASFNGTSCTGCACRNPDSRHLGVLRLVRHVAAPSIFLPFRVRRLITAKPVVRPFCAMFPRIGRTVKRGRDGGLQCVLRQLAAVSLAERLSRIGIFEARHGSPRSSSLRTSSTGEMSAVWVQSRGRGRAVTFCIRMPIFA